MKSRKFFWKLFPSSILLILIGFTALLIIFRFAFFNFYINHTKIELLNKANLLKEKYVSILLQKDLNLLQQEVKKDAINASNRITVVRPDGKVIAESDYNFKNMENHISRQEIKEALKNLTGSSIRFSPTLNEEALYLAIPLNSLQNINNIESILRLSMSVSDIKENLNILTTKLFLWVIILLFIFVFIIYYQAKSISQPLEEIETKVLEFSNSNFLEEIHLDHSDTYEIESLHNSIRTVGKALRRQMLKILKNKKEQEAIFKSMNEGILTIDKDLRIKHYNTSTIKIFEMTNEEDLKGQIISNHQELSHFSEFVYEIINENKEIDLEYKIKDKTIHMLGNKILDLEGNTKRALFVFRDITKLKSLENHRKDFVANVSHELKTPLTAMQGFLENLIDGDVTDEKTKNKFLSIIYNHTKRLGTIVEDLLSLSAIESEQNNFIKNLTKVNILINSSIDFCQNRALAKNIQLQSFIEDEFSININTRLFEQALINLIDNAIRYSPNNSIVKIISKKTDFYEISINDQGPGIEEIHHHRLFERFYSVDKARSKELGGTGLGLAIVKHIVLAHEGEIIIDSKLGQGSKFTIKLPIKI